MEVIDLIIIILALAIVLFVIGSYFYKKHKKIPTGECSYCSMKNKRTLNEIRKAIRSSK